MIARLYFQALLAENSTALENVKRAESEMSNVQNEINEVEKVLANQDAVRTSGQAPASEELLNQVEKLEYSLTESLNKFISLDHTGLNDEEVNNINEKCSQVQDYVDRLKKLREELLQLLSALRQWNEEKQKFHEKTSPALDEAEALIARYSSPQPFEKAISDRGNLEDLVERLNAAHISAEKAREELRNSVPDCTVAIEEASKLVNQLRSARDAIQVKFASAFSTVYFHNGDSPEESSVFAAIPTSTLFFPRNLSMQDVTFFLPRHNIRKNSVKENVKFHKQKLSLKVFCYFQW